MKKSFVCSPSFVSTQVLNKTPDFSFITPGDIFMPVSPPCCSHYPPCFLPSFLPRPLYLGVGVELVLSLGACPLSSLASIRHDINTASDSTAVQPSC